MLTTAQRRAKLKTLADISGFDTVHDMLKVALTDTVCPAICITEGCDYSEDMEPGQDRGWCLICDTHTMQSALVLARLI